LLAGGFGLEQDTPVESGILAFLVLLVAGAAPGRRAAWARLLPMMGVLARGVFPMLGGVALAAVEGLTDLTGLEPMALIALTVASALAAVVGSAAAGAVMAGDRDVRVAVVGSAGAADALGRELAEAGGAGYRVVGRIRPPHEEAARAGFVPTLGDLDALGHLAEEHGIELLLMTGEVPRLRVFEEISNSCLHLPMRLQELTGFYEQVFGHVPVGEINAAWFQYIMHPAYRSAAPLAKRALDVILATLAMPAVLPLFAILALVIRRDGGPAFFKQERIGEGGRPFVIYKLRTMRANDDTAWAAADDDRITRVGHVLRRTHLDELPQIVNVLRGEMSLVGPRPEQPAFVERLEHVVPFYSRRHLIKPGLTGWAQVRCGYAGSDVGSAWKVSHDLFYLKHRSFWLDLVIIGETLRTLVADPQYTVEPATVAFILRDESMAEGVATAPPLSPATI
jgi:exopolysaccharide biosynthesis polyprenyl glycosylphosphotransferase